MTMPVAVTEVHVRGAFPEDVDGMVRLMEPFIVTGDLLPRTAVDLIRDLAAYVVAVTPSGDVVGTGSLRRYGERLAEVQALAVHAAHQGTGVGKAVVDALTVRARALGVEQLFALTRRPVFFQRMGFETVDKALFPSKIWLDCMRCAKQHCCDETAVARYLD